MRERSLTGARVTQRQLHHWEAHPSVADKLQMWHVRISTQLPGSLPQSVVSPGLCTTSRQSPPERGIPRSAQLPCSGSLQLQSWEGTLGFLCFSVSPEAGSIFTSWVSWSSTRASLGCFHSEELLYEPPTATSGPFCYMDPRGTVRSKLLSLGLWYFYNKW